MAKRNVAQCRCCRLPLERPRRLWVVVVPVLRKPRIVAVCRWCWMGLREVAHSISVVGVNSVVLVEEGDYEQQRKSKRWLKSAGVAAGVA